jgi:hypothetical protein
MVWYLIKHTAKVTFTRTEVNSYLIEYIYFTKYSCKAMQICTE